MNQFGELHLDASTCCAIRVVAVICAGFFVPHSTLAEEDNEEATFADEDLLAMDLEDLLDLKLEVAAKKSQSQTEAPANVLVFDNSTLRKRGYRYLRDLLQDLPGYQVTQLSRAEWGSWLYVRGLPGNHRLVFLLNGHRLNPPGGEEVPLFANMPISLIERVEVMYGPGAALYGSDAFSGVVNIITRQQGDADKVELDATSGMNNLFSVQGQSSTSIGKWRITGGGQYTQLDHPNMYHRYPREYSYRLGDDTTPTRLDHVSSDSIERLDEFYAPEQGYDVYAGISYDTFQIFYYHRGYELSSAWEGSAQGRPFVPEARFSDSQGLAAARYRFELGSVKLTSELDFAHYKVQPSTRFVQPVDLDTGQFTTDDFRTGGSKGVRLQQQAGYFVEPIDLDINVGATFQYLWVVPVGAYETNDDGERVGIENSYHFYTGPGDTPFLDSNNEVMTAVPSHFSESQQISTKTEVNYATSGLYAQLLWLKFRWAQLTAGVRWDFTERFDHSVSPRAAIVSQPFESTAIKLLYSRGYLEPTPWEQYGAFLDGQQLLAPNPTLRPETLNAFELVWMQGIVDGLDFKAGGFVNLIDNIINPESWTRGYVYIEGEPSNPDWPGYYAREYLQTVNSGTGLYYGGDLSLAWRSSIGEIQWWIDANLSLVDGKQKSLNLRGLTEKRPARGISVLTAKGTVGIEASRTLVMALRWQYRTEPRLDIEPWLYPDAARAKPFYTLGLHGEYHLRDYTTDNFDIAFFVTAENFTDVRYKTASGRSGTNPIGTPQPAFRAFGGVSMSWDYSQKSSD